MPNAAAQLETDRALHTHRLGTVNFTTVPHHIEKIGPRVFLTFDEHGAKYILNLTPEIAPAAWKAGRDMDEAVRVDG